MSISGKLLTAYVDGVELSGNNGWTVEETADILDATVGSDRGWEREDVGVQGAHITCKGIHDIADGSLPVHTGAILSNVELFRDIDNSTPAYTIDEALCVRFRLSAEVRGRFEWEAELHARGNVVAYNDPSS